MKNPAKKQPLYQNDSGYLSTVESLGKNPLVTPDAGLMNKHSINQFQPSNKSQSPRQSFSVAGLPVSVASDKNIQNVNPVPNLQEKVEKNLDELGKQIKKLIIFKKVSSKSPESKFFSEKEEVKVKVVNKESLNTQVLQLNELITLRKVKTTHSQGTIKRMVHAPTLRIFDIEEEPISELKSVESIAMREWINNWRHHFSKSQNLARVYTCFWNSPEGCVSIVMEPAKNGFLLVNKNYFFKRVGFNQLNRRTPRKGNPVSCQGHSFRHRGHSLKNFQRPRKHLSFPNYDFLQRHLQTLSWCPLYSTTTGESTSFT
jgi:hypothetical protein